MLQETSQNKYISTAATLERNKRHLECHDLQIPFDFSTKIGKIEIEFKTIMRFSHFFNIAGNISK